MGFFASRWIEKHGAETEKAALQQVVHQPNGSVAGTPTGTQNPKSKWYGRKKDATIENKKSSSGNNTPVPTANNTTNGWNTWASSPVLASRPAPVASTSLGNRQQTQSPQPKPETDVVTVTLAQKLDELATANADGLLSDDEYRVLRQNLFERFGSVAAQIPSEPSLVKLPAPSSRNNVRTDSRRNSMAIPQGDSNFTVSKSSVSIRSNTSRTSSVNTAINSILRKVTRRTGSVPRTSIGSLAPGDDSASLYSRTSSTFFRRSSTSVPRTLVHKASAGSLTTGGGSISGGIGGSISDRGAYDIRSITSRRTTRSAYEGGTSLTRTTSRSTKGPPSSYNRRHAPSEAGSDEIPVDWTTAELRAEIAGIEEESRGVVDMFNGLELSTLTKHRPSIGHAMLSGVETIKGSPPNSGGKEGKGIGEWTFLPDLKTMPSISNGSTKSSSKRMSITSASMRSLGLNRKGSLGFLGKRQQPLPPLPPLPSASTSVLPTSNSSSSSLHPMIHGQQNRSSPQLAVDRSGSSRRLSVASKNPSEWRVSIAFDESDPQMGALEKELDDIRRKRADVILRYERRLEYLRARLRSAELHERLLK